METASGLLPSVSRKLQPSKVLATQDIHQLFQWMARHSGHHVSHRLQHLKCDLFPFRACPSVKASSFLCTPCLHLFRLLVDL